MRLHAFAYYAKVLLAMRRGDLWVAYAPEYIGIEATNVCNFKCKFCPQSSPTHHQAVPPTYLDEQRCALFLGKIRQSGVRTNVIHWTLDGEPFMHRQFADLCRIGVRFGFTRTHFATNGMLCSRERLAAFPTKECTFTLAIDFCADASYFEAVRGTKGSWQTIRRNIDEILRDEALSNISFEITDISSFGSRDRKRLEEGFLRLQHIFEQNDRIRFRKRTFHNATGLIRTLSDSPGKRYHVCPYPWSTFRVAASGEVVACCRDVQHKTVLGNLAHEDLIEIWNGKAIQELRSHLLQRRPDLSTACSHCDLPYDNSKFSLANLFAAAKGRLQLFSR